MSLCAVIFLIIYLALGPSPKLVRFSTAVLPKQRAHGTREEIDALKIRYKDEFKRSKIKHAAAIQSKKKEIDKLQNDNMELHTMMPEVVEEADKQACAEGVAKSSAESMSQLAEKQKEKFHEYRSKYRQLKDELVEAQNDNAELAEKIK